MGVVVLIGGAFNFEIRQASSQAVRKGDTVNVNLNQLNLAAR